MTNTFSTIVLCPNCDKFATIQSFIGSDTHYFECAHCGLNTESVNYEEIILDGEKCGWFVSGTPVLIEDREYSWLTYRELMDANR